MSIDDRTFDVIVVGAGMMGSAAARYLAMSGISVAIIGVPEPRNTSSHTGPFASHYDAARITRKLDRDIDWSRLSARSIDRYRELERDSGVSFFHETGALMVVGNDTDANSIRAVMREEAVPANEHTGHSYSAASDILRFPDATTVFHEPKLSGWIDPRAHIRAQMVLARRHGARYIENTAHRIDETGAGVRVTLRNGEVLSAGQALVACGAYTNEALVRGVKAPLTVFARTVTFVELDPETARYLCDMPSIVYYPPSVDHDVYVLPPVRYPDGRVYLKIGGDPVDRTLTSTDKINDWFRSGGNADVGTYLMGLLCEIVPSAITAPYHTGSCVTTFTPSGKPLIFKHSNRVSILAGGNGAGAKNADELGRLGAQLVLGAEDDSRYRFAFEPPNLSPA